MGPLAIVAGIGLAIGAAGTYMSYKAQKKQTQLMQKSAAAQRSQDNMKAARERREAIRNARLSSGVVTQNAANQGVSGSSAALGGLGSIQTQLNQGLSFLDGMNKLADQASNYESRANKAGVKAGMWNSIGGLGMTVFQNAGNLTGKG